MSKKASPTLIGTFVIGAVGLIVLAALLFGGAEFFTEKTNLLAYFPGSVKGLRDGSNVTFRGVRIGHVAAMQLIGDVDTLETLVEVTMEILPTSFRFTREGELLAEGTRSSLSLQEIVDIGLRAQLNSESVVTGQLMVELDFHPEKPAVYRAQAQRHVEVPTIPTDVEQLLIGVQAFAARLQENFDPEKAARDLQGILSGIDELVHSPHLEESLAGLNRFINDQDTQELSDSLMATLDEARATLQGARQLVNSVSADIKPLIDGLTPVIDRLDGALAAGEEALKNASKQIQGDSELAYELTATLDEVQDAARSLGVERTTLYRLMKRFRIDG